MDPPLISVVIPTRHRNDLLALCLDRLAPGQQTLLADQYEVIVTDDGSASTAQAMIEQRYPWAKWTQGPRKGPAANRNHGASRAAGEFIAFTDDDCLPSPQWLSAYAAAIVEGVNVYEGKTTCQAGLKSPLEHAPINLTGGWLWSCNMMVRRVFFQNFSFDENFPYPHMEDTFFREQLKQNGQPFVFAKEAIVDHPPRRLPSGVNWAATHECEVIYHIKMHQPPPTRRAYLLRLAKHRVRGLLHYPIQADTFIALYQTLAELVCVMTRYNRWVRQHPQPSGVNA